VRTLQKERTNSNCNILYEPVRQIMQQPMAYVTVTLVVMKKNYDKTNSMKRFQAAVD